MRRLPLVLTILLFAIPAGAQRVNVRNGGTLERVEQRHQGVRVLGGEVAVRRDPTGRVRWTLGKPIAIPADLSVTPRLSADDARVAAGAPGADTELVIWTGGPVMKPRLVWRVLAAGDARALVPATRSLVDAQTGRLLQRDELYDTAAYDARVFDVNPVVTPATSIQSLQPYLDPGVTTLDGPDFVGASCIDDGTCLLVNVNGTPTPVHGCGLAQMAVTNAAGDFLDYDRPAADTDQTDPFAEVQIVYQSNVSLAFFRGLGFGDLAQKPMQAVANVLIGNYQNLASVTCTGDPPVPNAGDMLVPLDNAAFFRHSTTGTFPTEDMMIFGQGSTVDFSYDRDVVTHELGHAVMSTVCPEYERSVRDARGLDLTPHGTNEGFADYFSMAMAEDSELAEYVGQAFGPGALRSGLNTKKCPTDLWGEEHQDGEPWMGALWDIRSALTAPERPIFDRAVYVVVDALGAGDTPIGDISGAIAAEVELDLGTAGRDLALAKFAARGWDDCDDRIIDLAAGTSKDVLSVRGTNYLGMQTLVPAIVQFRIDVPERAGAIGVGVVRSVQPGSLVPQIPVPPDLKVLVKKDTPITWTWDDTGSANDADGIGDLPVSNFATTGKVTGDFAPGTYYVQLANAGGSYYLVGVSTFTEPYVAPDAGPIPDAASPDAMIGEDGGDGGCGCRTTGGRAPAGLALLFLTGSVSFALVRRSRLPRR